MQHEPFSRAFVAAALCLAAAASAQPSYEEAQRSIERGDYALAAQQLQALLPAVQRERGETHLATIKFHAGAGREAEALAQLEPLLDDFVEVFGPNHPDTQIVVSKLVTGYTALGRRNDAGRIAARFGRGAGSTASGVAGRR